MRERHRTDPNADPDLELLVPQAEACHLAVPGGETPDLEAQPPEAQDPHEAHVLPPRDPHEARHDPSHEEEEPVSRARERGGRERGGPKRKAKMVQIEPPVRTPR